ncbi:MAG: hypothetical protein M0Z80_03860 [Treponema sp.]|nr:hypothetical protein [Treponema sp.]
MRAPRGIPRTIAAIHLRRGLALAALVLAAFSAPVVAAAQADPMQAPATSQAGAAGAADYDAASAGGAPASPYHVDTTLDWGRRVLRVRVSLDMVSAGLALPEGRLEAERMIDRDLSGLVKDRIFSLQVDSHRTVRDTIMDGSLDAEKLIALDGDARRLESSFSRDMRSLIATYEFSLDAVGALYVLHSEALPAPTALGWSPARAHTGIVIVANGKLPVHGERVSDRLRPCLFPRVFDSGMRLLLGKDRVEPAVLRAQGEVGYAAEVPSGERAGDDPLLIMAAEIFGTDRTDLVISRDDANAILELRENRDLLRQGKVTIVLDRSELVARSPGAARESTLPPIP